MKITIEYENVAEAKVAMDAYKWKLLVEEFDIWLRAQIKYSEQEQFTPVREHFLEMISDMGLSIYEGD